MPCLLGVTGVTGQAFIVFFSGGVRVWVTIVATNALSAMHSIVTLNAGLTCAGGGLGAFKLLTRLWRPPCLLLVILGVVVPVKGSKMLIAVRLGIRMESTSRIHSCIVRDSSFLPCLFLGKY